MPDISTEITNLQNDRAAIRLALADKGVAADTHNFIDFASDIANIPSGGVAWREVTLTQNYNNANDVCKAIFANEATSKQAYFRLKSQSIAYSQITSGSGFFSASGVAGYGIRDRNGALAQIVLSSTTADYAKANSGDVYEYTYLSDLGEGSSMLLPEWVNSKKWNDGALVSAANFAAINGLIDCTPGAAFTIYLPKLTTSYTLYPFFFDADGTYLSAGTYQSVNATIVARDFNVPSGAYKISFHVWKNGIVISDFDEYYAFSRTR